MAELIVKDYECELNKDELDYIDDDIFEEQQEDYTEKKNHSDYRQTSETINLDNKDNLKKRISLKNYGQFEK